MGPEEPRAAFNISINKLMCGDYIGSDHFSYIRVCLQIQVNDMMMEVSV